MVGVPKSKGCSACRTRSIKCDEARPSCSPCKRGGRKCPGYLSRAKFVNENEKLEAQASRKATTFSTENPSTSSVASNKEVNSTYRDSTFAKDKTIATDDAIGYSEAGHKQLLGYQRGSSDTLSLTGFRPPLRYVERQGIVGSFIQDIFPLGRLTVQHSFIGSWFWRIPEALHTNPAMDLAAEAVAFAYLAKKSGSTDTLIRSRKLYGGALKMVSIALHGERSRFSSETLCAILLLIHFENFTAMQNKSWITHTNGASRLIQLRGPDRHRTGFDNAMFMAFRPYFISEAIMAGTSCFLDDDIWRSIDIENDKSPLMPPNSSAFHKGLNHFTKIPGLMKDFKDLRDGDAPLRHASVYREAKKARSNMMAWFEKLQQDSPVPMRALFELPPESHVPFSSVYEYKDIMTATFAIFYSAYLIQLNNMLDSMDGSEAHLAENVALSHDICMSASYCAKGGFCGVQAMTFALPLALAPLPETYRVWAQLQINYFESMKESYTLRSAILDDMPIIGG